MKKITLSDIPKDSRDFLAENGLLKRFISRVNETMTDVRYAHFKQLTESYKGTGGKLTQFLISSFVISSEITRSEGLMWRRASLSSRLGIPMKRIFLFANTHPAYIKDDAVHIGCQSIDIKDVMKFYNIAMTWMEGDHVPKRVKTSDDCITMMLGGYAQDYNKIIIEYDYHYDYDNEPLYESERIYIEDIIQLANEVVKFNRYWRK